MGARGPVTTPASERFWKHVRKDDCWEWIGGKNWKGYGCFGGDPSSKIVSAHRFSWQLHYGPIPVGMDVCHRCDNPGCVNPTHLFVGTRYMNMRDAVNKNRMCRGERRSKKLTEADVRMIRTSTNSISALARRFGVSNGCIRLIRNRKRWTHVP